LVSRPSCVRKERSTRRMPRTKNRMSKNISITGY
jgi:hypothetical protein